MNMEFLISELEFLTSGKTNDEQMLTGMGEYFIRKKNRKHMFYRVSFPPFFVVRFFVCLFLKINCFL